VGYELGRQLKAQLNVDNVFNRQPPYPLPVVPPNFTGGGLGRYFSGAMGRYFILSAAYRL
jgi:outer membrane receptor protein involved in Fe transport